MEAANSMLKTLEEPPPGAIIFLIGSNEQRQLPTIRSRSQIVRFAGLQDKDLAVLLLRHGYVDAPDRAHAIAGISNGSITRAQSLLDEETWNFRTELHQRLGQSTIDMVGLAKSVLANTQSAGEEGPKKRAKIKLIFDFAIDYYRERLRPPEDSSHTNALQPSAWMAGRALACCIQAQSEVDRNITPAALVESWSTELAGICRAG